MRRLVLRCVRRLDRRLRGYSGTAPRRLSSFGEGLIRLALLAALALPGTACSYRLESVFFKDRDRSAPEDANAEVTGSIATKAIPATPLDEADLAYARAAAGEVMGRTGKDISQPWENPNSGARGMVTPLSHAYDSNGTPCRDFLASYVLNRNEVWLQGEACEFHAGKWEVRSMKPWKRS